MFIYLLLHNFFTRENDFYQKMNMKKLLYYFVFLNKKIIMKRVLFLSFGMVPFQLLKYATT